MSDGRSWQPSQGRLWPLGRCPWADRIRIKRLAVIGDAQKRGGAGIEVLRRSVKAFREHELPDVAAALTYYGLLALFPGVIALVSLLGLFGDPEGTTRALTEVVEELGPSSAVETFTGPIESVTANRGGAGIALILGLGTAIWSASGYVGAFIRASHVIHGTTETRSFWQLRPLQLLVTVAMLVLAGFLAVGLVMSGSLVKAAAAPLGLSDTAVDLWGFVKWPAMALAFVAIVSLLYRAGPGSRHRWFSVGGLVAILIWILASAAFALYVSNFSSYGKTYGALAGVIVLLIWLWITNLAILFGAQLDAEREA